MSILYKERDLVVPGEVIAEGDFRSGEGTFKDGKKVIANVLGLVNVKEKRISIIPLQGRYNPKEGDIVIGLVIDSTPRSWKVDIMSPWNSILPINNAINRRYSNRDENQTALFSAGDYILARVVSFDRVMGPALSILERGLGKLRKGRVINIAPSKIPRFIGRKQSMIEMIEKETNSEIEIGQNGLIWISSKTYQDENLVEEIAKMISKESHTSGLTDRVREYIHSENENRGNKNGK
ncbi:MAG: exosome complex RNA-binding protein Rrp4 [Candidatus Ranarchaeia archaeon]